MVDATKPKPKSKGKGTRDRAFGDGAVDDDLATRIFDAWRELRRGPVRRLQEDLYGHGADATDPAQMDALELVVSQASWRMAELAAALHLDPSTVTRTIDRLAQAGLVERIPAKTDARGVRVKATTKGRRHCEKIARKRRIAVEAYLVEFSREDAESLADLLERLNEGIRRVFTERLTRGNNT